jgi:hypothetical protein
MPTETAPTKWITVFGGEWPELADGNGSSLELVHPDADNSLGAAWAG